MRPLCSGSSKPYANSSKLSYTDILTYIMAWDKLCNLPPPSLDHNMNGFIGRLMWLARCLMVWTKFNWVLIQFLKQSHLGWVWEVSFYCWLKCRDLWPFSFSSLLVPMTLLRVHKELQKDGSAVPKISSKSKLVQTGFAHPPNSQTSNQKKNLMSR